jgi:hypothetical protein
MNVCMNVRVKIITILVWKKITKKAPPLTAAAALQRVTGTNWTCGSHTSGGMTRALPTFPTTTPPRL